VNTTAVSKKKRKQDVKKTVATQRLVVGDKSVKLQKETGKGKKEEVK